VSIAQRLRPFLHVLVFALLGAAAGAQKKDGPVEIRYPVPERIERAAKADDKGLLQWEEWKEPQCQTCTGTGKTKCATCERYPDEWTNCIECKGTKEATCRACGGLGHQPDPLDKVICPGCRGSAYLACTICPGSSGLITPQGGGGRPQKCPACRGDAGAKCSICNGTRFVEMATLKPSLREANAATLAKALAAANQALNALTAFHPPADVRKANKELAKVLGGGQAFFPPMKRAPKAFEDHMARIAGGANYQHYEEAAGQVQSAWKSGFEYYLKHQKRMLELAHKRAEANEKLLADTKGK